MIEIYINNQRTDINSSVSITLNATNEDWSNPTAVKNSFSKTISFPGTKNNNRIFGNLFNVISSNNFNFDTTVKNDTVILKDGILIESGYITLDEVKLKGNTIEYNTTFYSTLGQFFYNLKYKENEDGSDVEKTLFDMYYGFEKDGTVLTKEEENRNIFMLWNAEYIQNSWNALGYDSNNILGMHDYSSKDILKNITAAATYSGYYDDFDTNKILINNPTNNLRSKFGPKTSLQKWDASLGYAANWTLFEMPREMDEWEVMDLRSLYQRPAIRTKMIWDAISNPDNNGGFNIEWPEEMKDNKSPLFNFYNNTWIIKDRFNFDEYTPEVNAEKTLSLDANLTDKPVNDVANILFDDSTTVDLSQYQDASLLLSFNININNFNDQPNTLKLNWKDTYGKYDSSGKHKITSDTYSGIYYEINIYDEDDNVLDEKHFFVWTDDIDCVGEEFKNKYFSSCDNSVRFDNIIKCDFAYNAAVNRFINTTEIQKEFTNLGNKTIHATVKQRTVSQTYYYRDKNPYQNIIVYNYLYCFTKRTQYTWGEYSYLPVTTFLDNNTDANYISALFDGATSSVQLMSIDKKMLFNNTKAPLEYLLTFCKMLNLKLLYDRHTNTIKIMKADDYFLYNIDNITGKIDRSSEIRIVHNFYDSKIYKFALPESDTYIETLCSKQLNKDYCAMIYNTNNNILTGEKNVCENWIFNTVGEYKHRSVYFRDWCGKYNNGSYVEDSGAAILKGTSCKNIVFTSEDLDTEEGQVFFNEVTKYQDILPKLCLFDSDNKTVDGSVSFVFLNNMFIFGEVTNNEIQWSSEQAVILTDNLPIMNELNDGPCFINIYGSQDYTDDFGVGTISLKTETVDTIWRKAKQIPYFSPYLYISKTNEQIQNYIAFNNNKLDNVDNQEARYSTMFVKPSLNANNVMNIDNCIYLFEYAWMKYYKDWFDRNNKEVTCNVMLDNNKQISELMRKLYYFDGCFWRLNKITDIDVVNRKPTKCTFIKTINVENTNGQSNEITPTVTPTVTPTPTTTTTTLEPSA